MQQDIYIIMSLEYLLNPENGRDWIIDKDFVTIDPNKDTSCDNNLDTLVAVMLNSENIRGNTPLDDITRKIKSSLHLFINIHKAKN